MLTKDLLRVSRRGGGYQPQFVDADATATAARVIEAYDDHVGESRESLETALTALERDADDHKLVRGFAKLVERDARFEVQAPLPPLRARRAAFEAAEATGVVTEADREAALERAAESLGVSPTAVEQSLHADREQREILAGVDRFWEPDTLRDQYNLSLAQTALFDATELRVTTDDPRGLISSLKRLGLLYRIERQGEPAAGIDPDWQPGESEVLITGPDALFRSTRRYGTRFARLLRTLSGTSQWALTATIDDRGTQRELQLSAADPLVVPDADPVADVSYDSDVEADFATRFSALNLDWELVREPALLAAGSRAMVPDFAFDYQYGDVRIFFEIMGFWTPAYVQKKLEQFNAVEGIELLVAYDESLDAGETAEIAGGEVGGAIESLQHRAIPYRDRIRVKDVRDLLREYERELETNQAAELPDELVPGADVLTLEELAARHDVSADVIEAVAFPEHDRVGRTLVRPGVLAELAAEIEAGMSLSAVESVFETAGIEDTSAVLSALGYRVRWEGLGGGTIEQTDPVE